VESGIELLKLAKDAYRLYSQRSMLDRRRLINVVLSNCTLKAGKLSYTYKQPFDMIATLPDFEEDWAQQDSNLQPRDYEFAAALKANSNCIFG